MNLFEPKVLIFDLDDTLYDELTFVKSGFAAVANYLASSFKINPTRAIDFMMCSLISDGRGNIFDKLLMTNGIYSKKTVHKCITVYRLHKPRIKLESSVPDLLKSLKQKYELYLITDGNKIVQRNKIESLGLDIYFKKCFITHQYGVSKAKPSIYCFELIKKKENCSWNEMVYVGDNPNKDFINIKTKGVLTLRVLTGSYKSVKLSNKHEALRSINEISDLRKILKLYEN